MTVYLMLGDANGQYEGILRTQLQPKPIHNLSQATLRNEHDLVILDPTIIDETTIREIVNSAHSADAKVMALDPKGNVDEQWLLSLGVDKVQLRNRNEMAFMRIAADAKQLAGLGI